MRQGEVDQPWPSRAWIMAGLLGLAGMICGLLLDIGVSDVPIWRQILATFLIVAGIGFALSAERLRLHWAVAYALGAGLVLSFIGWFTIQYDTSHEIAQWPFLAAIFGLLISCPLFQTVRDEGAWRFPYQRLHGHAWTDAVIGAASLAFVGITFLLVVLVGALFKLINITFIERLWDDGWFVLAMAGAAFGAASSILRERDGLLSTLQRVVQIVLSVLAPILAAAVAIFLLALPFTGLQPLWETDHATPILLFCGAGALLFANAVIGSGREERSPSRILQISALVLSVTILPFAAIAAVSLGTRISQYGWTPERLWGAIAVGVALVYGGAYLWSVVRGRLDFDDVVRPLNIKLAIGTCALAIFLALPIVDFGSISTNSQLARLNSGKVKADAFDWASLKFDFGPAGRRALERIAKSGPADQRELAAKTLKEDSRWQAVAIQQDVETAKAVTERLRILPKPVPLPDGLIEAFNLRSISDEAKGTAYTLIYAPGDKEAVMVYRACDQCDVEVQIRRADDTGHWRVNNAFDKPIPPDSAQFQKDDDALAKAIASGKVEVRTVNRRQVFVDGKPIGSDFE